MRAFLLRAASKNLFRTALGGALLFALAGCGPSSGKPFACECEMLTDFDDLHRSPVLVCAKDEQKAPEIARGCAQLAAPAPVQSCTCRRANDAPATCREGCREEQQASP